MKNVTLNVNGMTCEGCARTVATALKRVDGVWRADVSLEAEKANLVLDDDVREEDLVVAVARAGYQGTLKPELEGALGGLAKSEEEAPSALRQPASS